MDSIDVPPFTRPIIGKEARKVQTLLEGFNVDNCKAWKEITRHFSTGIRHNELVSIANILVKTYDLPALTRYCHRSFAVLIKWFQDNWDRIDPVIHNIKLLDENNRVICGYREFISRRLK